MDIINWFHERKTRNHSAYIRTKRYELLKEQKELTKKLKDVDLDLRILQNQECLHLNLFGSHCHDCGYTNK